MERVTDIIFRPSTLNYNDIKAHGYTLVFLIPCCVFIVLDIALCFLAKNFRSNRKMQLVIMKRSVESDRLFPGAIERAQKQEDETYMMEDVKFFAFQAKWNITHFIVIIAYSILAVLTWDMLVSFDVIVASFVTGVYKFAIMAILGLHLTLRHNWIFSSDPWNVWRFIKNWAIIVFPLTVVYIYGFMALTQGLCGCDFSHDIPGHVVNEDGMNLSTAWMRYYSDAHICPKNKAPCMVYATLPDNAGSSVFINFQVNMESCGGEVCHPEFWIRKSHDSDFLHSLPVVESEYRTPVTEFMQKRIYSVLLSNLTKDDFVEFKIIEPRWNNTEAQVYYYRTLNPQNMTIIQGGDIGNSYMAHDMMKNTVSKFDYDLIMVGGDVAYDQNSPNCFRAYDYLLKSFPVERKDQSTGKIRVIPVSFSTGNHDFGVTSFSGVEVRHTPHEPLFKHYFPQNSGPNGEIPKLLDRRAYYAHNIFDELLIINLDAAYEVPMNGTQAEWLEKTLSESKAKVKFTQYHGPMYTSCHQDKWGDYEVMRQGHLFWTPLFDKYNVTISFENHTHSFKRSKRIRDEKADPTGTLYLGEGSWGVARTACIKENEELHDVVEMVPAAWVVKVNVAQGIDATAYDDQGNQIDHYYMQL